MFILKIFIYFSIFFFLLHANDVMIWCHKVNNQAWTKTIILAILFSLTSQTGVRPIYLASVEEGGGGHWSNNTWPTLTTSRQSDTTRREVIKHNHHLVKLLPWPHFCLSMAACCRLSSFCRVGSSTSAILISFCY